MITGYRAITNTKSRCLTKLTLWSTLIQTELVSGTAARWPKVSWESGEWRNSRKWKVTQQCGSGEERKQMRALLDALYFFNIQLFLKSDWSKIVFVHWAPLLGKKPNQFVLFQVGEHFLCFGAQIPGYFQPKFVITCNLGWVTRRGDVSLVFDFVTYCSRIS